jgi:GNAT superfamily N-acetyltransferase
MYWRLERADFKALQGNGTKAVLKEMTCQNKIPGLLAYVEGQPVGWCSLGPRQEYLALENSRILKRIDDAQVWSIVCFYIARSYRKTGIMQAMLQAAVEYARQQGAGIVEGYPVDLLSPQLVGKKLKSFFGYMGIASVFRKVGFVEVGRASDTQLIMRYTL